MADEIDDEKVSLKLLLKLAQQNNEGITQLKERLEKTEATVARMHADISRNVNKMHGDILSMHADVLEAKAVSREVAVRLTLIEKRSGDMETKIDRIYDHLGLVDA